MWCWSWQSPCWTAHRWAGSRLLPWTSGRCWACWTPAGCHWCHGETTPGSPHCGIWGAERGKVTVFTTTVTHLHEPRGKIPESVGEANEGQRDDVMHHHHSGVLAPGVHVDGGVNRVAVEAALDQVGYGDISRHRHATLPVWRQKQTPVKYICFVNSWGETLSY